MMDELTTILTSKLKGGVVSKTRGGWVAECSKCLTRLYTEYPENMGQALEWFNSQGWKTNPIIYCPVHNDDATDGGG